jgi:hypothetical protein
MRSMRDDTVIGHGHGHGHGIFILATGLLTYIRQALQLFASAAFHSNLGRQVEERLVIFL